MIDEILKIIEEYEEECANAGCEAHRIAAQNRAFNLILDALQALREDGKQEQTQMQAVIDAFDDTEQFRRDAHSLD